MDNFRAEIVWKKTGDIVPYANNAKKHSDEQVNNLASQIYSFGFDQPIVVTKENVIIKGHGRLLAAKKLNLEEVPVIVSTIDEYQAMAARIADNKVAEGQEYDRGKLKFDIHTLKRNEFDLKLTAHSAIEL
jgi:ParB/RepB/Spo0J family partition protein